MTTRVQAIRSSVPGQTPSAGSRLPGELWLNFSDYQFGYIDASKTAQKLGAVRYFSTLANYVAGDFVVQTGALWVANTNITAGAFDIAQWNQLALYSQTQGFLPLSGGTMTGALTLVNDPVASLQPATKQYADTKLPIAGGTMTGPLVLNADPASPNQAATKHYVDTQSFVPVSGGTMTGPLVLSADPTSILGAVTKQYADKAFLKTGGQISGTPGYVSTITPPGDLVAASTLSAYVTASAWLGLNFYNGSGGGKLVGNGSWSYIQSSGGTLSLVSGPVGGAGAVASGGAAFQFTSGGYVLAPFGYTMTSTITGGSWPAIITANNTNGSTTYMQPIYNPAGPQAGWRMNNSGNTPMGDFTFGNSGIQWWCYGNAYKPGGGSWLDSSDERIKNVRGDFTQGLAEVLRLNPVEFTYLGNDTHGELEDATNEAPYASSPHYQQALDGTVHVGLVAQEVEAVSPQMVRHRQGFIDGDLAEDIRDLDTTSLQFILINAVKELASRVATLEERMAA